MYSLHLQFRKAYYLPSFTLQGVKVASLSSFLPGVERHLFFYSCFPKGSKARLKKKKLYRIVTEVPDYLDFYFFLNCSLDYLAVSFLHAGNMSKTSVV